jgi:hypothetical protein
MKFPTLFTKIPKYKRFEYTPRHYDPLEEERKERESRIQKELATDKEDEISPGYKTRISGSFRSSRKSQSKSFNPSVNLIRLIIITILVVWIIAYLQFGSIAIYALILFVPIYIWLKFFRK